MAYYSPQVAEHQQEGALVKLTSVMLYVAILSSGFVLFEPAPFDLLILSTIFVTLFTGIIIPAQMKWVLAIGFVHLSGSFIGVLMSLHFGDSYMHIIVTTYMVLFAIGIIIMIYNDPHRVVKIIINAYVWAALITTILAIMGYFHIGPTYDLFTLYGRAKGGFKDPNVYGPFIVPPMLYLLERIVSGTGRIKFTSIIMFGILLLGLLLSFSRGAWGVFSFSALILLASMFYTAHSNRFRVHLTLYILISIIAMGVAIIVALSIPAIADLLTERASLSQSYDVDDGGRFSNHGHALKIIIEQPWGIGAKEFGWTHGEDVHNTFLSTFLIGGWIGGFSHLLIVFLTLITGFKYCFRDFEFRVPFVVFFATYVSLTIESWIIDIDHWRLLYVLLGMVWGIIFYQKYNDQATNEYN